MEAQRTDDISNLEASIARPGVLVGTGPHRCVGAYDGVRGNL